jgi:hypothetical protein
MQRRLLNDTDESENMESVDLTSSPPSPVNVGLFKRTPSLERRSLELRGTSKVDNCHYPVKRYLTDQITFHELIQLLDIIPVDYIHFDAIAPDQLEALQQHIASNHATNDQLKAEYDEYVLIFNSNTHSHAIKTVLLNALCQRWDLPNKMEEKNYRPRV